MTGRAGNAVPLTGLDARRAAVEALFRGGRGGRHGLGLGQPQVTTTARRGRVILTPALAPILLVGLGRIARQRCRPGAWGSGNNATERSDVAVGRRMWDRIAVPPGQPLDEVVRAARAPVQNWG